jgi:CheY-like chemotaxis protein
LKGLDRLSAVACTDALRPQSLRLRMPFRFGESRQRTLGMRVVFSSGMENGTSLRVQILLVDGDVRTARVLARMLRDEGFDVEVAADGALAIGRLSRSPVPDVVVADLATTHGIGLAVAHYARSRCPDVPVFLITEHPELTRTPGRELLPEPRVFTKPLDYAAFSRELPRMAAAPPAADMSRMVP